MRVLFLDDSDERCRQFRSLVPSAIIVNSAGDCIEALQRHWSAMKFLGIEWDAVFLDHDLGGGIFVDPGAAETGSEVVRWVVKHRPPVKRFIIHSLNGPAAMDMKWALGSAGYRAHWVPWLELSRMQTISAVLGQEAST